MNRLIQAAAIALALTAPALAHAETPVSVSFRPEQLATPAGVEAAKADIAKAADAYCRANPVEHTIAQCRQVMAAQMSQDLQAQAAQYAQSARASRLAQR